jgi:mono/diheme cytochrome c family protein
MVRAMKVFFASLVLALAACGGGGSPTGSTCPPTDPPTYANFGQAFFGKYCTSCHSATGDLAGMLTDLADGSPGACLNRRGRRR